MVKRVYTETVKKWLIGAGITVGTLIGGIFLYLSLMGVITITGYSGDQVCAGTLEDPCYAYVNLTAKEDIFIYPVGYDPWGRDTFVQFDPAVESWKLQRSWGKGWRDIPLNKTCTGTWCGAPNNLGVKYSYVLREGKDYQFRIVAYKNNPYDKIKWAVNYQDKEYLDPEWTGIPALICKKGDPKCVRNDPTTNFNIADSKDNFYFEFESQKINFTFEGVGKFNKKYNAKNLDLFDTNVKQTAEGYKWSHEFILPSYDFKIRIYIESSESFEADDKYIYPYGLKISFDDVLEEGYSYELFVIDEDSAYYEITRDWKAEKIKIGDLVSLDPTITVLSGSSSEKLIYTASANLDRNLVIPLDSHITAASLTIAGTANQFISDGAAWDSDVGGLAENGTNMFMSDRDDHKIEWGEFDLTDNGELCSHLTTMPDAEFYGMDSDGTVFWGADSTNDKIYQFGYDCSHISNFSTVDLYGDSYPDCRGVAIDGDYIWLTDAGNGVAYKVWKNGTYTGINQTEPGSDARGIDMNGTYIGIALYEGRVVEIHNESDWSSFGTFSTSEQSGSRPGGLVFNDSKIFVGIDDSNDIGIYDHLPFNYPSNPSLTINSVSVWSSATDYSSSESTGEIASTLNTALNNGACDCTGCSDNGTDCTMPFTFHSDDKGYLTYSSVSIAYDPFLTIVSPANNSEFSPGEEINMNVSAGKAMDVCYWNDGTNNYTMTERDDQYFYHLNDTLAVADYVITYICNASSDGYWHETDEIHFTVFSASLDITDPTTGDPESVSENDNITITFLYILGGANQTTGVTIEKILIGGTEASVISSGTAETFPLDYEDFEGYSEGTSPNPIGNWTQATFDTDQWLVYTGDGESGSTGPTANYDGYYGMVESSSGECNDPDTAVLYRSPAINFDSYQVVNVSFAYNMYGSTMGTLHIKENSTGSWVSKWSETGDQGTSWFTKELKLTGLSGTGNIAIWMECGASYTSDAAVDSVNITAYTTATDEFAWIDGKGWQVNVTVPAGSGLEDLFLNATYNSNTEEETETNAINYGAADTCTCAGVDTNWEVDMEDYCNLTTACNLGTGNLSFIGSSGYFNCSANLNFTNRDAPPSSTIFYHSDGCDIRRLIILLIISTTMFKKRRAFI